MLVTVFLKVDFVDEMEIENLVGKVRQVDVENRFLHVAPALIALTVDLIERSAQELLKVYLFVPPENVEVIHDQLLVLHFIGILKNGIKQYLYRTQIILLHSQLYRAHKMQSMIN